MSETRMYACLGTYRDGAMAGRYCSASFYSRARRKDLLLADAATQNPWMRPEEVAELKGSYGGTPVEALIRAHEAAGVPGRGE